MREIEWVSKQEEFSVSKGHPVHSFQKCTTQAAVVLKGTLLSVEDYKWLLADLDELREAVSLQYRGSVVCTK